MIFYIFKEYFMNDGEIYIYIYIYNVSSLYHIALCKVNGKKKQKKKQLGQSKTSLNQLTPEDQISLA